MQYMHTCISTFQSTSSGGRKKKIETGFIFLFFVFTILRSCVTPFCFGLFVIKSSRELASKEVKVANESCCWPCFIICPFIVVAGPLNYVLTSSWTPKRSRVRSGSLGFCCCCCCCSCNSFVLGWFSQTFTWLLSTVIVVVITRILFIQSNKREEEELYSLCGYNGRK